jgi:hypothetical protein
MSPTGDTAWPNYAQHVPECLTRTQLRLRRHLIAAIGAAVRLFEPFLDAVIAKDVLALRETQWGFVDTLGADNTEVIIADHASCRNVPSVSCTAAYGAEGTTYFARSPGAHQPRCSPETIWHSLTPPSYWTAGRGAAGGP